MNNKVESVATEAAMYDLIYLANGSAYSRVWQSISKAFPEATLGYASDYIHPHRFSVSLKSSEREWLKWLIREELVECSLCGQLAMRDGKHHETLAGIVADLRKEKEGVE